MSYFKRFAFACVLMSSLAFGAETPEPSPDTQPRSFEKSKLEKISSPSGSGVLVTYIANKNAGNTLLIKLETKYPARDGNHKNQVSLGDKPSEDSRDFASQEYNEATEQFFYFLAPVETQKISNFASVANDNVLKSETLSKLQRAQAENFQKFSMRNGYYATSRDTIAPIRPTGLSPEEELEFQRTMASALKKYVLLKGLPKLLFSSDETKSVGKVVEGTLETVHKSASLSLKSKKTKWAMKAGINPITFNSSVRAHNEEWYFSASSNLKDIDPSLSASRVFGYSNQYNIISTFKPKKNLVVPGVGWKIDEDMSTSLDTTIPYKAENMKQSIVTSVSFLYSF